MKYRELREKHQREVNSLPIYYAFGQKQLQDVFNKLGLNIEKDMDKVTSLYGVGDIVLKTDVSYVLSVFDRHWKEKKDMMQDDEFVKDMFVTELGNHEWVITMDDSETLTACGLSISKVAGDQRLLELFSKAKNEVLKWYKENN